MAGRKRPGKRTPRPPPVPKRAATRKATTEHDPEIQVSYAPAGRETLAAISDDLLTPPMRDLQSSAPQLDFHVSPVGRETLSAISQEVAAPIEKTPRRPLVTHPGVAPPANSPQGGTAPVGRETLDAIAEAMLNEVKPPSSKERSKSAPLEAFELANFVVRGENLAQLATEATRREFVADRLLHRLPVDSLDQVDRVDVVPWSVKGTLILRVWCRVPPR